MTWARTDDAMLEHPKWIRAVRIGGSAAVHLWVAALHWCSRHLTDGEIPVDMLDAIGGPRGAKVRARAFRALAEASLTAQRSDGGISLVNYCEFNPSRAKVLDDRGRRAKAQQDYADRKKLTNQQPIALTNQQTHQQTVTDDVPARPRIKIPLTPLGVDPVGEVASVASAATPADAGAPAAGSTSKPRRRRRSETKAGAPLPADWAPTEAHRAYAAHHGLDVELEADALRGWAEGRATLSWNGTFATRLANAAKWKRERGGPAHTPKPAPDASSEAAWLK